MLTMAFVAAAVVLMLLYALTHRGRMGQHVSANPELRRRGVGCVQSQDREARMEKTTFQKQK